jgi:hypothetical protein
MRTDASRDNYHMSNCHAEVLNELMQVELAAARTYQQAMWFVREGPHGVALQLIHDHHRAAVDTLCREIRQMGCEPEHDCDSLIPFQSVLENIQDAFNDAKALIVLRQGEMTGLHTYEDALLDQFLPGTSQTLIRTKLLPRIRKHIEVLEQLLIS